MNFPSQKFVSISFQPEYITLVVMEDGVIQSIATKELIQPFDLETLKAERDDSGSLYEILERLGKKININKGCDTGVVLNSGIVTIRKIPVAIGLEDEFIENHMRWEAEQSLVSPLEEFVVEFQRLPFQTPSGNPTYVVIVVRRVVIDFIHSMVHRMGLKLREVDIDIFSSIRVVVSNYDTKPDRISAIIDVQNSYLNFIFIRDREYFLSHFFSIDEESSSSNLSDEGRAVEMILKELRRLIFGHKLGERVDDLSGIFLTGTGNVRRFYESFSSSVNIPVEIVNPFSKVKVAQSVYELEEYSRFPEKIVPAVGMLLKSKYTPVKGGQ